MGLVVLEGLVILVLVLTGFRSAVFHAVPAQLKTAISVGIGLFIALIGLVDAGFVRRIPDAANTTVPGRSSGPTGSSTAGRCWCSRSASMLMITLYVRKVRGAILISILVTTVLAIVVEAIANVGPSVDGKNVNPNGWNLNVPGAAGQDRRRPRLRAARPVLAVRRLRAGRRRDRGAVRLHADARRLLRHHGHDDRDRRRGGPARRGGRAAEQPADPGRRLARRRRRWRGRRLQQHLLHRVRLRRRRGRPHRPGQRGDRRAVPARHDLRPARRDHPQRGGRARPGAGRLPDDAAGQEHRLGRRRDRPPGVPDDRADAVHLLDLGRHRRRVPGLRADQGRARQGRRRCTRCCGWSRPCSSSTSSSTRSSSSSAPERCDARTRLGTSPGTARAVDPTDEGAAHEHHSAGTPQGRRHRDHGLDPRPGRCR